MLLRARAPVRIDFAGAWTDVDVWARAEGGAVLSATIDRYVTGTLRTGDDEGLRLAYGSDLPAGTGLGTSAALNVVWLALAGHGLAADGDRRALAERAYRLEELLGIIGGRQDQYAAALGGMNLMRFGADAVAVEPLAVAPETVAALEARAVLCHSGRPRLSTGIHEEVWAALRAGRPGTVAALHALRDLAPTMAAALVAGDLDAFAALLAENWAHQRALHASVTNARVDELFALAGAAGAQGGKACGAGGGGCLVFVCAPGRRDAVAAALAGAGARVVPFRFAWDGLTVEVEPG